LPDIYSKSWVFLFLFFIKFELLHIIKHRTWSLFGHVHNEEIKMNLGDKKDNPYQPWGKNHFTFTVWTGKYFFWLNNTDIFSIYYQADVTGECKAEYKVTSNGWYTRTIKKSKDLLACVDRHGYNTVMQGTPYRVPSVSSNFKLKKKIIWRYFTFIKSF
jgi:hypothetical protein